MRKRLKARGVISALLAFAVLAGACGDDGATGAANTDTTTPQRGGSITVAQLSAVPGLDPAKLAGGGSVGGIELAAVYDTLMRYDPDTQDYEPRTAESFEPNADFSRWTLKLRAGLTFGDGTPYDAEAVRFVLEREMAEGNSAIRSQLTSFVKKLTVTDPRTVEFELSKAWAGFPSLFASAAGMIYSPAAYRAAGENFNVTPGDAGLGPFKVKSYRPGEALELVRNPNYWGGDVYLDEVRFVLLAGPAETFEALRAGSIQAAFLRDPAVIADARAAGFAAVEMPAVSGSQVLMNAGVVVECKGGAPQNLCAGKPDGERVTTAAATADVRVRRAVAAAVAPAVINDRAFSGKARPNSAIFAGSPWDPKVPGPKYDPSEARRLIAEAKADGWDGTIRVLAGNDPFARNWAQAVATQLQAVGMSVKVDTTLDTAGVVAKVLVQRDYDLVNWGSGLFDESDANYLQLASSYTTGAARYGYASAELDAAIDALRLASTEAERTDAYRRIAEVWARDVPTHVITDVMQAWVHAPVLHGPTRSGASIVLLDKTWIER